MNNFKILLDELRKLNLPSDQYAIFGSGPIAIRGIREGNDIDLIVKPQLWKKLLNKYPLKNEKSIVIDKLEIFKDWSPWFNETNELVDNADIFDGIRFVKLKYVLLWKKKFAREKDLKDVILIEDYLKKGGK
jgi:hypothetical protein